MKDRYKLYALLLAMAVGAFYLLTLRPGQGWMDDYAQYVLHARNIAEGRPYADTGYIFNPDYQVTGPATYPPVFPLLLAPVYKLAGMDLQKMKAVTVIAFSAFLYFVFLLFRPGLGGRRALLVMALLGLSPVFWKFKDYLYSEYPFMLFSFAALYAYGRVRDREVSGGAWKTFLPAAGVLAYLAYGTRSAGALLLPVFLFSDLAALKKPSKTFFGVCVVALVPALAQNLFVHGDAVYAEQARYLLGRQPYLSAVLDNLLAYPERLSQLFGGGWPGLALFAAFACLAAAGFVRRAREKVSVLEVYAAARLLFIVAAPVADGPRYAFSLVPFIFYYALPGIPGKGRLARFALPALLAASALAYGAAYARADRGVFREGAENAETRLLFDFVRQRTPADAVFVFRKPRTLTLYTGRRAAVYHQAPDAELLGYLKRVGAGYLVTGSVFAEDVFFLSPFIERNRGSFSEVYSSPDFRVYRIK